MEENLKSNNKDGGIPIPKYFRDQWEEKRLNGETSSVNKEICNEKEASIDHEKSYTSSPFPPLQPLFSSWDNADTNTFDDASIESLYRKVLIKEARQFIEENTFNDALLEISKEIIGQEGLELVLAGVFGYISGIAKNGMPPKVNMLLTAPSGTGKTETFRVLKSYFQKNLPNLVISQVDVTHITSEGFKGKDTDAIVIDLIKKNTGGYGIVFMDEFDKRISPQFTSEGGDVGQDVQNQILTLIEGNVETYTNKAIKKTATIDSNLTMFIGCGSFNLVREKKKKEANKILGFLSQKNNYDIYDHITREDILDAGCSYEMLGRFPLIINYHKLELRTIERIIEKLKHSIMRNLGFTDLIIDDSYMQDMINMANGDFGCRMLYSSMFQASMNAYKEVLKKGISHPVSVKLGNDYFEVYEDIQCMYEKEYEA